MLCRGRDHCQIHLGLLGFCPGDHIIHLAEPGCDMFEHPLPLRLCIGFRSLSCGVLFLSGLQRTAAPSRKNQGIFITGEQLESLLKFPQRLLIPLLIEPGIAQTEMPQRVLRLRGAEKQALCFLIPAQIVVGPGQQGTAFRIRRFQPLQQPDNLLMPVLAVQFFHPLPDCLIHGVTLSSRRSFGKIF